MKTPLRTWLGLALIMAVASLTSAIARRDSRPAVQPHDVKGLIPWRSDLNSARQEAQAAHKLVLVEIASGWCPDCQAMADQTWSQPLIAVSLAAYVPVMIDPDVHSDLAQRFSVVSIPTLLLIDPSSGKVLRDSRDRVLSPDELQSWLKG